MQWRSALVHSSGFICLLEFDLILRDAAMWPAALLEDILDIPSVEFIPVGVNSRHFTPHSVPNPMAYIPQLGTAFTPEMVHLPLLFFASNRLHCHMDWQHACNAFHAKHPCLDHDKHA